MGYRGTSALRHHCTGAWCPACPPPGLQRSKFKLSSHTCSFVMARSTVSISFSGRQRVLVQINGRERPFLCSVGEGEGCITLSLNDWARCSDIWGWSASVSMLVGLVFSSGLGQRVERTEKIRKPF